MPPKVAKPSKPRPRTRVLMRWKDEHDKKLLLAIQSYIGKNKISVDWDTVARMVDDKATGGAIVQHLAKIRDRLKSEGHDVPPSTRQSGGRTRQNRSVQNVTSNVVRSGDDWEAHDVEMTGMGKDDTNTIHSLARRLPSKSKRSNPDFLHRLGVGTSSNDGEDDDHSSSSTATCGNDDDSEIVGANDPAMRFDSAVQNNSMDIGMGQRDPAIVHDTSNAGQMSLGPFGVPQNNGRVLPSHLAAQPAPRLTTNTKNSPGRNSKQYHQGKSIIVSFPVILIGGVAELRTQTEVMAPPKKKAKANESSSTKPKSPETSTRATKNSRPTRPPKPAQQNKGVDAAGSTSAKYPVIPKNSAKAIQKQKAKDHGKTFNTKFPVKRSGSDTNDPYFTHRRKNPQGWVPKDPDSGTPHSSGTFSNPSLAPSDIRDDEFSSMPRRKHTANHQFDEDWLHHSSGPSSPFNAPVSQNESRPMAFSAREQLRDTKRHILVERIAAKVKVEEEDRINKSNQPVWEVEDSLESLAKANGVGPEQNYGNYHPSQLSDFSGGLDDITEPLTDEASMAFDDSPYPRAKVDGMCAKIVAKHAKGKQVQGLLASSKDPVCYSWSGLSLDAASANGDVPKKRVRQFEDLVNLLDDENFHEKVNPYPQEPKRSKSVDWESRIPQYILDDYEIGEDGAVRAKFNPLLDDIDDIDDTEWSGIGFADPAYATAVPVNTDFTAPAFTAPAHDDPAFADPASAFTGTGFTSTESIAPAFTAPTSADTGFFDPNLANLTSVGPGIVSAGPFDFPLGVPGICDYAPINFPLPLGFGYNAPEDAFHTPFANDPAGSITLPSIPADCLLDGDRGTSDMVGTVPAGIDPNRPMGYTSFADIEKYPYPGDALADLEQFNLAGQLPPVNVENMVTAMSMGSSLNFDNYGDQDNFGMAVHLDMSILNHNTDGAGNTGNGDDHADNGPADGADTI